MTGFRKMDNCRTLAAEVAVELKNRISCVWVFSQPPAYRRGRHNLLILLDPRLRLLHLSESRISTDERIPRKMDNCRTLAAWVAVELERIEFVSLAFPHILISSSLLDPSTLGSLHLSESRISTDDGIPRKMENPGLRGGCELKNRIYSRLGIFSSLRLLPSEAGITSSSPRPLDFPPLVRITDWHG